MDQVKLNVEILIWLVHEKFICLAYDSVVNGRILTGLLF